VLGFGGHEVLDHIDPQRCRDEIAGIIENANCKTLAFDLTGVTFVPSGLLGLLASLRQFEVEIYLFNPNEDVRDVLEISKLDRVRTLCEVELPATG